MKTSANIANKTAPLIAFLILLVIWELGVRIYHIPSYILASPSQVLVTIAETYPMLWFHGSMTLLEAISGFVLAIVIAFIMAFLLDTLFWLNQAVYPLLI